MAVAIALAVGLAVGAISRRYRIRIERQPLAPAPIERYAVRTATGATFTVTAGNPREASAQVRQDGQTVIAVRRLR